MRNPFERGLLSDRIPQSGLSTKRLAQITASREQIEASQEADKNNPRPMSTLREEHKGNPNAHDGYTADGFA
ncbi:MAG: hypothetical protein K0S38_430 [Candidatus Paceibacter sp.]|jgi:hypothetical protein|nr:hypothetical protein [Candidatus Paceibacter sp.]